MKKNRAVRRLTGLLAILTLLTLLPFSLLSCSEAAVSDVLEYALTLAEETPGEQEGEAFGGELTLNEPTETEAPAPETEAPAPETEAPVPETEAPIPETEAPAPETEAPAPVIDENGTYDDKENVALYLYTYGKLPSNYISKKEAEALGWTGGSLERYAPGKCIGGSYFGNYEGILPKKKGREYHECDIGTLGRSSRGAKRIVWSNDGLIYYTEDHYETFELLYGGN